MHYLILFRLVRTSILHHRNGPKPFLAIERVTKYNYNTWYLGNVHQYSERYKIYRYRFGITIFKFRYLMNSVEKHYKRILEG